MKIFWSWQSDLPGKVSRHFVREALEEAIDALNQERMIEEPDRREASLDHDRKGVPGSPDLANLILEKIRNSEVFVADVTPVGQSANTPPKKLMNPNVAIELGYALHTIGDRKMIMVMNSAFGARADLPFDLQSKAGPILYDLAADASKTETIAAKKQLISDLKIALRAVSDAHTLPLAVFPRVAHIDGDPSRYFAPQDFVVDRVGDGHFEDRQQRAVPTSPLAFLRIIPTTGSRRLTFREAESALRKAHVPPFSHDWRSMSFDINAWGAIAYETLGGEQSIVSATQLHRNCELWGFDSYLPSPTHKPKSGGPPGIWAVNLERAFELCLPSYLRCLTDELHISPPFTIVAGLSGVKKHVLAVPSNWSGLATFGPFLEDPVVIEVALGSADSQSVTETLLAIYQGIFNAVGEERPLNFRNFPKPPAPSNV